MCGAKIVKGECRSKRENLFSKFDYAELTPFFWKKSGKNFFTFPSQCFRSKSFIYRFFYYFFM